MSLKNTFTGLGIAGRMVIYIFIFSSFVTLSTSAIQLYLDYRGELDLLSARFEEIEHTYATGIQEDLWNVDHAQVRVQLEALLELPDIYYVRLTPENGRIIEVGDRVTDHPFVRHLALDVEKDGRIVSLGSLYLEANLDGVYTRLKQRTVIVLIGQAVRTFLVTFFMMLIIHFVVIRHLERIAYYARHHMTFKQLDEHLELDRIQGRDDELDHVADAFNDMQDSLKKSYEELLTINHELEHHKENLEHLVDERTEELRAAEQILLENAHSAGMAEIAIGVMHHIGNTLNSLNISSHVIEDELEKSCLNKLLRANKMLSAHREKPEELFANQNPKGVQLIDYYLELGSRLRTEQKEILAEVHKMVGQLELMKEVVASQQEYARGGSYTGEMDLEAVVEEALRLESYAIKQRKIKIIRQYEEIPSLESPPSKVRYVILHILKNAQDAIMCNPEDNRIITVDIHSEDDHTVSLRIGDNGMGIPKDKMIAIFKYGYTTKKKGNGFGLHACANAMIEMKGRLTVESDGPSKGAVFKMVFPLAAQVQSVQ